MTHIDTSSFDCDTSRKRWYHIFKRRAVTIPILLVAALAAVSIGNALHPQPFFNRFVTPEDYFGSAVANIVEPFFAKDRQGIKALFDLGQKHGQRLDAAEKQLKVDRTDIDATKKALGDTNKRVDESNKRIDTNAAGVVSANKRIDTLDGQYHELKTQQFDFKKMIDEGQKRLNDVLPKLPPMSKVEGIEKGVAALQGNFLQRSTA